MEHTLVITNKDGSAYDIFINDSFKELPFKLQETGLKPDKIGIIADSNTTPLYGAEVLDAVKTFCPETFLITIPAGENHKNLETISMIYDEMVKNVFTRKSILISLGGGVCGDMTGFAAATYMRGIPFIQIPTTLLSQVDASIGGKTGVDYHGFKNMVGAFHMPSLVYINMNTLKTLPDREIRSGMAEVIKSALIKDKKFYEWLRDSYKDIHIDQVESMSEMVLRTCRIKQQVVMSDPFENGDRMLLNLGHTIGHAIEKAQNFTLTHGECVGLGLVAACQISYKRGLLDLNDFEDIKMTCSNYGLSITLDKMNPDEILKNTKSDKKMQHNKIRFILLDKIGDAFITDDVSDDEILDGINAIKKGN